MDLQIWSVVIALFSGVILSLFLDDCKTNKCKAYSAIKTGLLGGIVVTLVQVNWIQGELIHGIDYMKSQNVLPRLEKTLINEPDGPFKDSLYALKDRVENVLSNASVGVIKLSDSESVITEWGRMFNGSRTSIFATNYISEDFWNKDPRFKVIQREAHENAIKKGVIVKRIFITDMTTDIEALKKVAVSQKRLGVSLKFLDRSKLENSQAFLKAKPDLGGSIDFVLFDLLGALITTHEPDKRSISSAKLTNQRDIVDTAFDLFRLLWEISEKDFPKI